MRLLHTQRNVHYFGINLIIPEGAGYVATDASGDIHYFPNTSPVVYKDYWVVPDTAPESDKVELYLGKAELDGMDFRHTLMHTGIPDGHA